MPTVLSVSSLHKRYREKHAVKNVSFSIQSGEAVGLLGANGAGKSTLIKCILGLTRSSEGSIDHPGTSPAYLPELPQLPTSISALNLLRFKCKASGLIPTLAEESLAAMNLAPDARSRPIGQYSKGMRQRTALALTLCGDPQLVCLDEPMSGLDALGRAEVLSLLGEKKQQGAAFLMSSHIVSDMVQLCDRVLIMAHGCICEEVRLHEHSLAEAKVLEEKLARWTRQ
ncbi:ABC-2 type transport system ATP-binding protein [Mariprofundus ferrinatatus]|uniref:ABC-2 type transport system ATP-binding protein n=1 Tax=Mariprofundus ferrinatatus TaxID=1921087 RepID=A0A2K8L3F0_9PROT|nr:ABC transporter ATP-binding protein [Mariprofundus ferrinatatus]ATX81855.1 ABC-2 type transport system ATP-binding protein [Mariprofundus ferrinatatus]